MSSLKTIKAVTVFLILSLSIGCGSETESQGKIVKVLLDVSGSSPLWNPAFAQKAGGFLESHIRNLPYLSTIEIINFGLFNKTSDDLTFKVTAKPGHQPEEVGKSVANLISNIGLWAGKEQETSLIGKLEKVAPVLRGGGKVIIISDFVEESSAFNFFRSSGPMPSKPGLLNGTEVVGIGLGVGLKTEAQFAKVKTLWLDWFKSSGAGDVQLYSDIF